MTTDPNATRRYPLEEERRLSLEDPNGLPELPEVSPADGHIGPYALLWKLGSGTATTVFAAQRSHDRVVNRAVAIRTLNSKLTKDAALVDAFMDEARIAARITHPCVCAVHDVGKAPDGTPYQVMDYLVGEPFSRLLPRIADRETYFSLACAVRLTIGICEGLHAIHDARDEYAVPLHVVHGRVRPENLFAMYDGTVRVLDFGGASAADHQRLSKANTTPAAFPYMSPEQLRSESIDARSDIWSLGVVLWEMLTGRRLFRRGAPVATAVAVLEEDIPHPSSLNALVHPAIDAIVARMLERDPDRRWESARDVADELELALSYGFGTIAPGKLAGWLDAVFPGCQDFRWRLVMKSRDSGQRYDSLQTDAKPTAAPPKHPMPRPPEPALLRNLPAMTPVQPFNVTQELDPAMFLGLPRTPNAQERTPVVQTADLSSAKIEQSEPAAIFASEPKFDARPPAANRASTAAAGMLRIDVWSDGSARTGQTSGLNAATSTSIGPAARTSLLLGTRRIRVLAGAAAVLVTLGFASIWRLFPRSEAPRTSEVAPAAPRLAITPPSAPVTKAPVPHVTAPPIAPPHGEVLKPAAPRVPDEALAERPTGSERVERSAADPRLRPKAAPAEPRVATGQVYLTSRSGPLLVLDGARESATPVLLRLPEGPRFLYVRRDKNEARRAVSVNVIAGQITGISLE